MYNKIFPSLELDITDLLEDSESLDDRSLVSVAPLEEYLCTLTAVGYVESRFTVGSYIL